MGGLKDEAQKIQNQEQTSFEINDINFEEKTL